jgi:hypothetical protein
MGFLSSIIGAAAPIVGGIFGGPIGSAIGGAVGGLVGGKSGGSTQSGTQTVTQQQQLDPRIADMLFGSGGNQGLLSQYQQLGQQPQNAGNAAFGGAAQNWLGGQGGNVLSQLQGGASNLMNSNIQAPQAGQQAPVSTAQSAASQSALAQSPGTWSAPAAQSTGAQAPGSGGASVIWNKGAQINAPGQNNLDLTGAYSNFISGNAAENPYLTGAIQKGINQSSNAFGNMLSDAKSATQDVLGGIRSNSVLAGQYGSSRQGIAEGKAIDSLNTQLGRAASQFGQNNTDAAIAAQAQAFNQGQDRSLAATQGLGAQQYGVAGQNAGFQQQANLQNQSIANETDKFNIAQQNAVNQANAGLSQQNSQYNAGLTQSQNQFGSNLTQQNNQFNTGLNQANNQFNANLGQSNNQFNAGALNQGGQFNASLGQQANLANLQAQLGTNSLNSANQATGLGALSGLLGQAYGYGQNQDNFALNRAQQMNSLLAPYLSANSSSNINAPLYSNPGGNILGGAAAGLGLYNQFANLGGSGNSNTGYNTFNVSPGTAPVNTGALQDLSWLNNIGR